MKIILVPTVCFSIFFASMTSAKSANLADGGSFFNTEIFSLSKKKENAFDAASATYVIGSEEIRRSGATSIPEALKLAPGLQVARINGNQWAISARGFNAQYSNKLLVMIDGRIIYTPVFSGVLWDVQDYIMDDIDRIEVVRGPGGTIWGANAVNGIINIITKNAAQTQGFYASQVVGDQDSSITELRFGGKTMQNDDYRIYAKRFIKGSADKTKDGTSNGDGSRQERAGFRYDVSSIKDSSLSLHGDVYSGVALNYFNTILQNPSRNNKGSRGGNLVLNWDKKLSKKSNFVLNSYFDYDEFHIPVLQRSARTYDIDFQHFYDFSKNNQFIWGLGYRRVDDNIKESDSKGTIPLDYTPNDLSSYVYSGFIQDKIGIIPDELYLTVGSKFLNNNFTGFEYQPNAKLAYYPSRNQTIWASASKAVRTPTRGEDGLTLLGGAQRGSQQYESEDVMAYELGYRIKPTYKTSVDISTFVNQYSNLRTFEDHSGGGTIADNKGYGESYGFEVAAKWQVTNDWKLEFDYDFLKTTLHIDGDSTDDTNSSNMQLSEGQSPQQQFKIKSFYNITPKIEFDNILYYVDELSSSGAHANIGQAGHIPAYVTIDTRLGYLPTRSLDLSVGIKNLLDQRHSEFKEGLANTRTEVGRTVYARIVWQY